MNCPDCGGKSKVVDSRITAGECRRRRECLSCKERFTTWERVESIVDVEKKTIETMGELIRSLSDQELSQRISKRAIDSLCDVICQDGCLAKPKGKQCHEVVEEWLKSEAKV